MCTSMELVDIAKKENKSRVRQETIWIESSNVFTQQGIMNTDNLTHYHLQHTGPTLHHFIFPDDSLTLVINHSP